MLLFAWGNFFIPPALHIELLYRVCLNSSYSLWGLAVGTKTVTYCLGTHVQKHISSRLQTNYYHPTCCTIPLLVLTVRCFFLDPLTRRTRCDNQRHHRCGWEVSPPLWARWWHTRLSRSGPGFDLRSGQVSWVRFFRGFSSSVRQMSGSFRPPRSPNITWPSLSSIIIHYGRQWPEMLTRPKTSNMHTYIEG